MRSGPIYWGVIYLAKKIIRWWYFTFKKLENIICDAILHVNMLQYFKIPYFTCTFFTFLSTMNILIPNFYRTLFYDFRQWTPQVLLKSWTSTNYFSNSTNSSINDCRFSPIVDLHPHFARKCVQIFLGFLKYVASSIVGRSCSLRMGT